MPPTTDSAIRPAPTTAWGILRAIGPGLILTANIVGTGELIATTRLGSQVGFAAALVHRVQLFHQGVRPNRAGPLHAGRGCGQSRSAEPAAWSTLSRVVGALAVVRRCISARSARCRAWSAASPSCLLPSRTSGRTARGRSVSPSLTGLLLSAGPLQVRREELDRHGRAVHVLQSSGGDASAEHRVAHDVAELAQGLSFGLPDDLITAFAVFGITGVGAAELIFYPIWCLEKGYARATGPRDDSPEWYERARGWMRVMKYDAWFSMADLHRRYAQLLRARRRHPASSRHAGR